MTTTTDRPDVLEVPTLALDRIHHHPANPRRTAVASAEMVESILAAGIHVPLMVAPHPTEDGDFILIDGHRRDNGARQAGLDTVPVNVRYDLVTEAQQLEVMVITGLQGEHLTPVEEAAAYEQLQLAGMDDDAIARATGFSKRRVRDRLKLNDLSSSVRDRVHDGEVSLTDIAALEEFTEDHEAYAQVEAHLGTPNFRQVVHNVRSRLQRQADNASTIAEWVAIGAVEIETTPGGPGMYRFDGQTRVDYPNAKRVRFLHGPGDLTDPAQHADHLGWYLADYDYAEPDAFCLDTTRHPELAPTTSTPVESDWEKKQAEREAERARLAAADQARREWIASHLASLMPTKSHKALAEFASPYLRAIESDRSPDLDATATKALEALAADLGDRAADEFTDRPWVDDRDAMLTQLALWDWLTGAGYPMSDVDVELRTRLETRLAETDDEDDADG